MTFPQSTLYGHLGVRSSTQFAAMAAANFVAQTILVDDGSTSLKEYRSDGVSWVPTLTAAQVAVVQALASGGTQDASSRNITAADNGKLLAPTAAITYTIPDGLLPMPSFTVDCPASGTISIARSGTATLNGAATTLTRTRAANPVGFVVVAHSETDAYGVSGA